MIEVGSVLGSSCHCLAPYPPDEHLVEGRLDLGQALLLEMRPPLDPSAFFLKTAATHHREGLASVTDLVALKVVHSARIAWISRRLGRGREPGVLVAGGFSA